MSNWHSKYAYNVSKKCKVKPPKETPTHPPQQQTLRRPAVLAPGGDAEWGTLLCRRVYPTPALQELQSSESAPLLPSPENIEGDSYLKHCQCTCHFSQQFTSVYLSKRHENLHFYNICIQIFIRECPKLGTNALCINQWMGISTWCVHITNSSSLS